MQRSARRADRPEVTIHNDGTYTVRPNQKGRQAHGKNPAPPPLPGVSPARAPLCAALGPGHKPKKNQQKENTSWKTGTKKK